MSRPLTAADRVPEVGDVLVMLRPPNRRRMIFLDVRRGAHDAFDMLECGFDGMVASFERELWGVIGYVRRADGGPVEAED